MDINQFVRNVSWKKMVIIALIGFFGLWIAQEIAFWNFYHEMQQRYAKFDTQFERDQHMIHNKIVEAETRQKAIKDDMDTFTEEFHKNVDNSINQAFGFQQDVAEKVAEGEQKIQRDFVELPKKWRKEDAEFVDLELKEFNQRQEELEAKRHQDFIAKDKSNNEKQLAWKKNREIQDKKAWNEARKRFFQNTGKELPTYDEFKQNAVID